jgi:hypothetical protein
MQQTGGTCSTSKRGLVHYGTNVAAGCCKCMAEEVLLLQHHHREEREILR